MSKRKNKGAKRTPGKLHGENFAQLLNRKSEGKLEERRFAGMIVEGDIYCIALKRMGLLGPKRILELDRTVREVRNEFLEIQHVIDGDDDDHWYTAEKFDEQLKNAVGEENFVPWDMRHEYLMFTDGVRTVEMAAALRKAKAEVAEKRRREAYLEESKRQLAEKFGG